MKAVVTRVKSASVEIGGKVNGQIGQGYLILLGVGPSDTEDTAVKLADKICNLRIFEDENEKMNLNLEQVGGSILVVSQFTVAAQSHAGHVVPLDVNILPNLLAQIFQLVQGRG